MECLETRVQVTPALEQTWPPGPLVGGFKYQQLLSRLWKFLQFPLASSKTQPACSFDFPTLRSPQTSPEAVVPKYGR